MFGPVETRMIHYKQFQFCCVLFAVYVAIFGFCYFPDIPVKKLHDQIMILKEYGYRLYNITILVYLTYFKFANRSKRY